MVGIHCWVLKYEYTSTIRQKYIQCHRERSRDESSDGNIVTNRFGREGTRGKRLNGSQGGKTAAVIPGGRYESEVGSLGGGVITMFLLKRIELNQFTREFTHIAESPETQPPPSIMLPRFIFRTHPYLLVS